MTQTQILLTVTHKKPLPADWVEMVLNRAYMLLYSRGVEVGVDAKVVEPQEKADAPL
jgi:hypothetical protein